MLSGVSNAAALMPAGAVAHQDSVRARHHLRADLREMDVHRLGVRGRHDDCGSDATFRADRAKDVGTVMAVVADHGRPRADRRPDVGVRSLLADAGLVLKPDLDGCARGAAAQRLPQQGTEVFLKASSAAGSFLGWQGRG